MTVRPIRALFFDLDETLVPERPTAERVILSLCQRVAREYGVSAEPLKDSVFFEARALWYAFEHHSYCKQAAFSSWEGLWARFEGDKPSLAPLREFVPRYRRQSWRNALAAHGVDDAALADELAETYPVERARHNEPFPEVKRVLTALKSSYRMGVVTNGPSDLQRLKLDGSGLAPLFGTVVVAGDVEARKPLRVIFDRALELLGCTAEEAVMIGDGLEGDIAGAHGVGMRTVWINRDGRDNDSGAMPDAELPDLAALPQVLQEWVRPD